VNREIGDYENGNYQTVDVMRRVARQWAAEPVVRQLALKIIDEARIKSHNFNDEVVALARFVQQYVRYVRDPNGVEQLHSPGYMIRQISEGTAQGDCDDQALLLATLLLSIGAQPYFAIVRYRSDSGPFNHIYVVTYEKNWTGHKTRLALDTIIKDRSIGFEVPHRSIEEIPV